MTVQVQLFALARQLGGRDVLAVELPEGATVADLRAKLAETYPVLAPLLSRSLIAVDEEYAENAQPLTERSAVACIPPVSGG